MAKKSFYTVWVGRVPGVYASWEECQQQVKNFSGASFRGFVSREQAEEAFAQGSDKQIEKAAEPTETTPVAANAITQGAELAVEGECEYF